MDEPSIPILIYALDTSRKKQPINPPTWGIAQNVYVFRSDDGRKTKYKIKKAHQRI
ncbi:hypothetical protein PbJCM17693_63100 [Paenibacillus macerans]|nr:hypothetical protein PbJCM17693_63100 [Paenibacillus macerans]